MKSKFITLSFVAVLSLSAATFTIISNPIDATAQTSGAKSIVDKAITEGIVGETPAGYLALVTGSAEAVVVNAMNEINIGRKTLYTSKARKESVPVEQVAALFGEKQIRDAKPGEKVLTGTGRWVTR